MTACELPQLMGELKEGLQALYGDRLRGLYLFGSYARGTAEWDPDVDVLVVLDEIVSYGSEIKRTSELGVVAVLEILHECERGFYLRQ